MRVRRLEPRIDRDHEARIRARRLWQPAARRVPRADRRRQRRHERAHAIAAVDAFRDAGDAGDEVVVIQPVRAVNRRLSIADRIPHEAQPRRDVVPVARERVRRRVAGHVVGDVGPHLHLIPHAELRRQPRRDAPVVLREQRKVPVGIRRGGIAVALHVASGKAQLHGDDRRHLDGRQPERGADAAGMLPKMYRPPKCSGRLCSRRVDVVEIEARLELMRAGEIADGVEHLVALVLARLRRKALAPDAGHAEHLERRPALVLERARAAAPRVERIHRLIAVRDLKAQSRSPSSPSRPTDATARTSCPRCRARRRGCARRCRRTARCSR